MLSNSRTIFDQLCHEIDSIYDPEEARNIVFLILEEKLNITRAEILARKETDISNAVNEEITKAFIQLKKQQPVQYVLGNAHFYGLKLKVDHRVLIPRQETEELVDWIIKAQHDIRDILDIGTGSGCIALSLARGYPGKEVVAWDHSIPALTLAKENADALHLQIEFKQVDILADIPETAFDLIVSNPPYIPEKERTKMSANVLEYEPEDALFVLDHHPLLFYDSIVRASKNILRPGGWLYFEINERFGQEVLSLLEENSYEQIELRKDLNGKDRMVRGKKK